MRHAGFVLVGGRSSRMGRDKALLTVDGVALARRIANQVEDAVGSAALIGNPAVYGDLGFPVIPDQIPNCGPLGGIVTALGSSHADWSLIVACDMPSIDAPLLRSLVNFTKRTQCDAIVPVCALEPQPLCAVYHGRCLPLFQRALRDNRLKMKDLLSNLRVHAVDGIDPARFENLNSPADWSRYTHAQ